MFSTLPLGCATELRFVLSGDCVVSSHSPSSLSESPSSNPTVFFLPELERGRSVTKAFFPATPPLVVYRRSAGLELFFFIDSFGRESPSNAPSQCTWPPPRGGLAVGVAGADFLR